MQKHKKVNHNQVGVVFIMSSESFIPNNCIKFELRDTFPQKQQKENTRVANVLQLFCFCKQTAQVGPRHVIPSH